ncbi:hypothetical protein PYCCODRAFT_1217796 [Trametes coccinea BRFM310]|uniref:BRCT domain-containing protein n=1 Tax=Trametes coccinea (strain BRFM310) TaxID=1353009 RepID=A0A1Y2I6Q5_TRAC3|nr:hypothetical protein PYCCODRAFT_1217796 [Trametes coccinea BRFM310]
MALFDGQAWFSPRVPARVRYIWTSNGGSCAGPQLSAMRATYVFCDGIDDPWFHKLYERSFAVFHWLWISAVADAQFRVPISKYTIDGFEELSPPAYSQFSPHRTDLEGQEYSQNTPKGWTCESKLSSKPLPDTRRCVTRPLSEEESKDVPSPSPVAQRSRVRSTPFVDLRRRSSKSTRSRAIRIQPLEYAAMSSKSQSRQVGPPGALKARSSDAFHDTVHQAIPVSVALESLSSISVDSVTQFVPGSVHLGKEFRCFYVT